MYIIFIRTTVLYLLVILVVRLMGKRQIGELQPYELVMTIMIADLAALPMQDSRLPLLLGIIPIVTLLIINVLITEFQIKSPRFRKFVDGTPCVLICKGQLNLSVIKTQRLSLDDVLEQIREGGYLDISEIQYAILENNGKLSLIPKSNYDVVKKQDLNINTSNPTMPLVLYFDGKFNNESFIKINKNTDWLNKQLKSVNAPSLNNLYLVMLDSNGKLFYQYKNKDNIGDELV